MLSEQDMIVAAQHMARHYKKPDGTYPENAKQLRETVAWKAAEEKAAKALSDAGLPVTTEQIITYVFEKLLKDSQKVEKMECHLIHPKAPRAKFADKEKSLVDAVYIIDPSGRIHTLENVKVPETADPASPITLSGEGLSIAKTFGSTKKAPGEENDEDEDDDTPEGVAFDPPRVYYNISDNEKLKIEIGGHDKPFPMGGPWIDGRLKKAARPSKKGSIFGRVGPSDYDGLSADEPFIMQGFVERVFLNEWESGTVVSTICKTPGKAEVSVLHPIEELAASGHFPGIANADKDSIRDFFESKPRFLAIGNCDLKREYTLSKMQGEERETHEKLLSELQAKGMLKTGENGKAKYLDTKNNPKITVSDGKGGTMEVPKPYVTAGERNYIGVRLYKNRNDEIDAKFSVIADTPTVNCYERKGTYDDGNEFHKGAGFRCVWLSGGGIQLPDQKSTARVMTLFG